jgi:hypothetical protein
MITEGVSFHPSPKGQLSAVVDTPQHRIWVSVDSNGTSVLLKRWTAGRHSLQAMGTRGGRPRRVTGGGCTFSTVAAQVVAGCSVKLVRPRFAAGAPA